MVPRSESGTENWTHLYPLVVIASRIAPVGLVEERGHTIKIRNLYDNIY